MSSDCEIGWRHAGFFVDVVATDLNLPEDGFSITNLRISDAADKTAGLMSLLHRVTIEVKLADGLERGALSYVVKEKPEQAFGGFVDLEQVFAKEIEVYRRFVAAFEETWRGDGVKFGPRIFKVTTSPFTVIVMEDLKTNGFLMKDAREGLSLKDCERTLQKLAQFHAASVVYFEQNGPYPDKFKAGMFDESRMLESFYAPLFESYLEALVKLEYPEEILNLVRRYRGRIYKAVSKQFRFDDSKFNVLNHGDLWVNNIQLKDNDVLMIDYQISFYGSPTFDLLYLNINSGSNDVRTDKFDHLVDFYHRNLAKSLKHLKSKSAIPTLDDLHRDIQRHGLLVLALVMDGAMMSLIPDKNMDLMCAETSEGAAYRRNLYAEPQVIAMLEKVVPFMRDRRFLEES